jgi:hypothetical protein
MAAVRVLGVEQALKAVRDGKLQGELMSCGPESEELVRASLSASREAMAAVGTRTKPAPEVAEAQAQASDIVGSLNEPASGNDSAMRTVAIGPSAVPLSLYRQETTAYYLELRCRHLPDRQTQDFWQRIVDLHHQAMSSHGGPAVSQAKQNAEASAARLPCGRESARLVRAAYAEITSR